MKNVQNSPLRIDDADVPIKRRRAVREAKEEDTQKKNIFGFLQENSEQIVVEKEKPAVHEEDDEDEFDFSFLTQKREELKDEEVAGEYSETPEASKKPEREAESKVTDAVQETIGSLSLLDRIHREITTYNERNTGVFLDTADFKYCDGVAKAAIKDDAMLLPIRKVYLNGMAVDFDRVGEVRIPEGVDVELDLGVSVVMPDNVELALSTAPEVERKFGVTVRSKTVLRRQDALFPIVVKMRVLDTIAYISKYHGVIEARFLPV